MFVGLEDFNVDIFLRFEDKNIYLYYIDFETIPGLESLLPLGSFHDGRFKFINLRKEARIEVGTKFLIRDMYAYQDPLTENITIAVHQFVNEFSNIPEVMEVLDKYINLCKSTSTPNPSWCTECNSSNNCPDYCRGEAKCSLNIPISVFTKEDLYFLIVVYFNGIYRTNPEEAQDFSLYETLTDIDFNLNKYTCVVNIQEFFANQFQYFLQTGVGAAPFAGGYGTTIKLAVQTKNNGIRERLVEDEINYFIKGFNSLYGELIEVHDINIVENITNTGADAWQINVFASVKKERLVYRIEF